MPMTTYKHLKPYQQRGIVLAILLALYWLFHHLTSPHAPPIPLPTVIIQKPIKAPMVEYVTQTGTTVAYNSVDLVARVEGYLDAIQFVDGSVVKKGQPLFIIQPEPYKEQLNAAKATVAAQKAAYTYSKAEYARQKRMYKDNATSLNNVEKWLAKTQEFEAEVAKALANEAIAAINYGYTHIVSPFDGRIGRHLVDIGNLVGNEKATNLATIEQIDPLYVYFNLNEIDLLKLRAAVRANGNKLPKLDTIPVDISLQNDNTFTYHATLDFVNTGLNASTGTMELRALLDNHAHIFVPGLFVQVRVAITKPLDQLTIPDTAILYDQIGAYVLTVNDKQIVVLKRVTLGSLENGMRAILKGLDATDNVITAGLQQATPGNPVQCETTTK